CRNTGKRTRLAQFTQSSLEMRLSLSFTSLETDRCGMWEASEFRFANTNLLIRMAFRCFSDKRMKDAFNKLDKFEGDLGEAADNLRANSKLTSSDYFMPVLGVIFLASCGEPFRGGAPTDRGRPGQRQDAEAQGSARGLRRSPLALLARTGPIRLDHGAG